MTHCAIAQNGHNLQNESISQYLFDSTTQPLRLNPIDYEVSSRLRTQLWSRDRPGSMKQFETRAVQDMCAAAASSHKIQEALISRSTNQNASPDSQSHALCRFHH
jgi:hypothetical protein